MWCPSILYTLVFLAAVAAGIWSPLINGSASSAQSGSDIHGGCILPEQPVGGRFELHCHGSSCSGSPGSRVLDGTFLTYNCSEGYLLQGYPLTFCFANAWYQPPACIKTCPVPSLKGIDAVFCRYYDEIVSCESPILPGTKAVLSCQKFHKIMLSDGSEDREITCLEEGVWSNTELQCSPECGTALADEQDIVVNGITIKHAGPPWHVGVYEKESSGHFELICGGTLISPDLVISAAHCFYDETLRTPKNASKFLVAADKDYESYDKPELYEQESTVKRIDVTEKYFGLIRNYEEDIALLRLEIPLTTSKLVRPVCIDWYNTHEREQLRSEKSGKTVQWGKTDAFGSAQLQKIDLPCVPFRTCLDAVPESFKRYITPDKFCAGELNGPNASLRNSVTSELSDGLMNSTTGCILPKQPTGGSFDLDLCGETGNPVAIGSVLVYHCNEGYTLKGNNMSFCYTNGWNPPTTCVKTCPALKSTSVDIVCEYTGEIVSCESAIVPGTKATLACKNLYEIPLADYPAYREITCLEEGVWDRPVFRCSPECGSSEANGISLNTDGSTVRRGGFPWHVIIYKKSSGKNFEKKCAGTLVHPDLVVSAAHCFYDETTSELTNASHFTVAAGESDGPYIASKPFIQKSTIKQIRVTERYIGFMGRYAQDIALIRLEVPFNLTAFVKTICIDWDNKSEKEQLARGKIGKVLGSSMTATGAFRTGLQEVTHRYLPYHECVSAAAEEFKSFITADKFCSHSNGSKLCSGDGGGGLYVQSDGLWFLRGIVSVSPAATNSTCSIYDYTTFTNVGNFVEWIRAAYFGARIGLDEQGFSADPATCSDSSTATSLKSGCVLPDQPTAGSFELGSCNGQCNATTGSRVPIGSLLTYTCDQGYTLVGNNISVCFDDAWFPPPTCVKKYCPALRVAGVNFDCKLQGKNVSCELAITPGTKATLACKYFYEFLPGNDFGYREITCLENGTWDRAVVECVPAECGRAVPDGTQVVVNGSKISPCGFPWHVHVYHSKNSASSFSILTVGTLISPNLVLSRAWSVTEKTSNRVEGGKFAVTAGNYHTSYGTLEPYAQKSLVSRIVVEKGYNGSQAHFTHNRALLYLETFFEITAFVRPICMDWYGRVEEELIENKNWDKLVGWYDYLSTSGNETYKTALSYIPYEECNSRVRKRTRPYVTTDTFCVDCSSGLGACGAGTHAPGVGYEFYGVWYLLGSQKLGHFPDSNPREWIIVFFKVGDQPDWIRRDWIRNLEY